MCKSWDHFTFNYAVEPRNLPLEIEDMFHISAHLHNAQDIEQLRPLIVPTHSLNPATALNYTFVLTQTTAHP